MLIQNESMLQPRSQTENPLPLKEGGTYNAIVKEKLPNNEAVIQIKGQEMKVKVEGAFPSTGKVMMQVTNVQQEPPVVKAAVNEVKAQQLNARQQQAGIPDNVKQAVRLLQDNNIPITKETLTNVKTYMEKALGTPEQKLETIAQMAGKKLEFTTSQMKAVHETLHGKPLGHVLQELAAELDPDYAVKNPIRQQDSSQGKLAEILAKLEQIVKDPAKLANIQQLVKALQQGESPKAVARMLISLQIVPETVEGKALGQVLQKLVAEQDLDNAMKVPVRQQDAAQGKLAEVLAKLEQIVKDPAKLANIQQLAKALQQGESPKSVARALISEMSAELKVNPQLEKVISSVMKETTTLQVPTTDIPVNTTKEASLQSIVQNALKQVKTVPNLANVIQFVKESAAKDEWSQVQKAILQEAVGKAEQFQSAGRELAARQELATALTQLEKQQPQQMQAQVEEVETTYRFNSEILAAIPVESRDLIVTTISKKLSQAALDFKAVQRDISNALQTTESLIKQAPIQARPPLELAIKQLDNAILKSDFMLYTDMGTEKKLLQASSQLHEARKLLTKGELAKASEIVQQVKTTVDKLMFQPSDVRVKHYVSKELLQLEQPPLARQLSYVMEEPLQTMRQEPTARHALEYMRSLGLSYDSDVAHRLVAGESAKADADTTLKNLLLKLAQIEGTNQTGQKAEQALQNLTGQQLMSKPDTSGLQTMLFSLPIVLQDQVENVKVFLKSNNSGQKIDWENCSLYFLLETKKLGDVGIMLTAIDRTISLTLKNDQHGFKERMMPLAEKAKDRLGEIGYKIGTLQFSTLTEAVKTEKKTETVKQSTFTERGYDFSV
ncbi:hypothetical protein [Bacillus sp. FSL K6-3431]|uniref:hypothetical protein n=1 Tax=Bacillus sp. FSL K6-3431 TaxID=2921500 RepID=UPI0030F5EC09